MKFAIASVTIRYPNGEEETYDGKDYQIIGDYTATVYPKDKPLEPTRHAKWIDVHINLPVE